MAKRFKLATSLNLTGLIAAFALFYLLLSTEQLRQQVTDLLRRRAMVCGPELILADEPTVNRHRK